MRIQSKRKCKGKSKIIKHPHIERRKGICGGEPVIRGTRITVSLIVQLERNGHSVDEIVSMYPHINHAQIYDALSYYYDNKNEIDKYIEESSEEHIKKYSGRPWIKW